MGARLNSSQSKTIVNASITTGVESIIVAVTGIQPFTDNTTVYIGWMVNASAAAGMTTCKVNLRRGTLVTDTLLNVNQAITFPATETQVFSGVYFDTPGAGAGLGYLLSFLSTGGTTTINDVALFAFVL